MKEGINKEEALSLLQIAMQEPLGILVYASDRTVFTQALYRARKEEPEFASIQIRQTQEGVAICHPPVEHASRASPDPEPLVSDC